MNVLIMCDSSEGKVRHAYTGVTTFHYAPGENEAVLSYGPNGVQRVRVTSLDYITVTKGVESGEG